MVVQMITLEKIIEYFELVKFDRAYDAGALRANKKYISLYKTCL